jgi:hypothetical protein
MEEEGQNALEVGQEAPKENEESPEAQSRRAVICSFPIQRIL